MLPISFGQALPSTLLDVFNIERSHIPAFDVVESRLNGFTQRQPSLFSLFKRFITEGKDDRHGNAFNDNSRDQE